MESLYTSGEVAKIIGVPHPTLRSWQQRGLLNFVRLAEDLEPGSADEEAIRNGEAKPDEDGFLAWRWSRFTQSEIWQVAVMLELMRSGISAKLASVLVEQHRPTIFGLCRLLCIARHGDLYAARTATDLEMLEHEANWHDGQEWRVSWMGKGGQEVAGPAELYVPKNLTILETTEIRARVDAQIQSLNSQ